MPTVMSRAVFLSVLVPVLRRKATSVVIVMKLMIPRVINGCRRSRLMVVPVVYAPVASFAQVRACAFYEKIALCRACLVGKCLQSERLTDAHSHAVYG